MLFKNIRTVSDQFLQRFNVNPEGIIRKCCVVGELYPRHSGMPQILILPLFNGLIPLDHIGILPDNW